jgi:hypothetical protein
LISHPNRQTQGLLFWKCGFSPRNQASQRRIRARR